MAVACVLKSNANKAYAQEHAFDDVTVKAKEETIALTKDANEVNTEDLIDVSNEETTIKAVDVKTIDTSKEGEYVVTYTLETKDSLGDVATKTYKKTFTVTSTDEVAPVIKFNKDTVNITLGDSYDPKDNIKSVKDEFDGDVSYSKEGTDGAYYTIDDSKLNTSKKGTYKITVTAVDSAGNEATKTFKVKVKKASSSSASASSTSTNNSNKSNTTTSKNNSSPSKNTTTNKSSSSSSSSSNKNTTSSGSSNSSGTIQKQQSCHTVIGTGHYETVITGQKWVIDSNAWDEQIVDYEVVVCNGCGAEFSSEAEWSSHMGLLRQQGDTSHSGYSIKPYYTTIRHDATGHYENTTEQKWVQDTQTHQECN